MVGLGTCLTVDDAAHGIAAGASFVVSPVFGEDVVQECVRQNKVVIPGCNTPTEMYLLRGIHASENPPIYTLFLGGNCF